MKSTIVMYAIKAAILKPKARTFSFTEQKTMYDGKRIAEGDTIFIFASENEGGLGLIARGVVTQVVAVPRKRGVNRQPPRVSIGIKRTQLSKRPMGRRELKAFNQWDDGKPQTELNFKFYRQATNKVVALSDQAGAFLDQCF